MLTRRPAVPPWAAHQPLPCGPTPTLNGASSSTDLSLVPAARGPRTRQTRQRPSCGGVATPAMSGSERAGKPVLPVSRPARPLRRSGRFARRRGEHDGQLEEALCGGGSGCGRGVRSRRRQRPVRRRVSWRLPEPGRRPWSASAPRRRTHQSFNDPAPVPHLVGDQDARHGQGRRRRRRQARLRRADPAAAERRARRRPGNVAPSASS